MSARSGCTTEDRCNVKRTLLWRWSLIFLLLLLLLALLLLLFLLLVRVTAVWRHLVCKRQCEHTRVTHSCFATCWYLLPWLLLCSVTRTANSTEFCTPCCSQYYKSTLFVPHPAPTIVINTIGGFAVRVVQQLKCCKCAHFVSAPLA